MKQASKASKGKLLSWCDMIWRMNRKKAAGRKEGSVVEGKEKRWRDKVQEGNNTSFCSVTMGKDGRMERRGAVEEGRYGELRCWGMLSAVEEKGRKGNKI